MIRVSIAVCAYLLAGSQAGAWTRVHEASDECTVLSAAPSGRVYAGFIRTGIAFSDDDGQTWSDIALDTYPARFAEYSGKLLVASGLWWRCATLEDCQPPQLGLFEVDVESGSWRRHPLDGVRVVQEIYDVVVHEQIIYAASGLGILASTNGGLTWDQSVRMPITDTGGQVPAAQLAPMDAGVLYAVSRSMWSDVLARGDHTLSIWTVLLSSRYRIGHLLVAPQSERMYVGLLWAEEWEASLVMSMDRGASWIRASSSGAGAPITDIAVRPGDGNELYCVADGSLLVSEDAGYVWRIIGGQPAGVQATKVLPLSRSNEVLVGTGTGELYLVTVNDFATGAGGASWGQVKAGAQTE